MEKITQTAGKNQLGEFAPEFAHFNDDVLFGENWNNQDIDVKTRSIITVTALMSSGIIDSSLIYHLQNYHPLYSPHCNQMQGNMLPCKPLRGTLQLSVCGMHQQ